MRIPELIWRSRALIESPSGLSIHAFGTSHSGSKRDEGTPMISRWQPCSGMHINRLTQRAGNLLSSESDGCSWWDGKYIYLCASP